jgi:para-nitrobenzyl esterase
LEELQNESQVISNFGFLDFVECVNWTHKHIHAFGADPSNMIVVGHGLSAGMITNALTVQPTQELFPRVILQSPLMATRDLASAIDLHANALAENFPECGTDIACLRSLDAADIASALDELSFVPVIDGLVIQQSFETAMTLGAYKQVPIIAGTVAHEGAIIAWDILSKVSSSEFSSWIASNPAFHNRSSFAERAQEL